MKSFEIPPATIEQFLQYLAQEYDRLSKQFKLIARCVETLGDQLGLVGVKSLAEQCGVQPSSVVRFAKHFGFSGFSEMQWLFRDRLMQQLKQDRTCSPPRCGVGESGSDDLPAKQIIDEVFEDSIIEMEQLRRMLDRTAFGQAIDMLTEAQVIWLAGSRHSFSVAVYLEHALQHIDKRIGLFSALGGTHVGQTRLVRPGDVLIAVAFNPYVEEISQVMQHAVQQGARLIAITDSRMNQLAREAEVVLMVQDHATFGVHAMTAVIGLAHCLFAALSYRLERTRQPALSPEDTKRPVQKDPGGGC
ncbi:MurR/RpiR family transcriptional regulator [Burkholderia multivorans]|uniref:MurR/RpiR family transcriptional regulator n=1 Tax=Burkholderia multivorans TaxID=87883 RepID=UPI0019D31CE6|nr:MurR/RpiR family transcriptional regulator [Burkholderia multivorans]MBN7130625.1 MurR/RpiR family transcriptional regulator [Burkholderia multivorans]QSL25770.1 MurR/RpiR family transcriptional regulator [Burkholderia multivorans]